MELPRSVARPLGLPILAVFGLLGCGEPAPIDNLNGGRIEIIGHGGSGLRSRANFLGENSWPSIRRGLDDFQADGVELDVQLTQDNVLVLFHDERMETGSDCHGAIRTKPAAEVLACRHRHAVPLDTVGEDYILAAVPTIERIMKRWPLAIIYLDLKSYDAGTRNTEFDMVYVRQLEILWSRLGKSANIRFQSGRWGLLRTLRLVLGPAALILYEAPSFRKAWQILNAAPDLNGIVIDQEKISPKNVAAVHRRGWWVVLYNVKSPVSAQHAIACSPDVVQTDSISLMQTALEPLRF